MLTPADLQLEQDYQDHKRHLLNLVTVGVGVVTGLVVSTDPDGSGITVSPGLAIDGLGREIIVPAETRIPWPTPDGSAPRRWGAVIELATLLTDAVPTPNGLEPGTMSEVAAITVVTEQPAPDDAKVVLRRYGRGPSRSSGRR